MQKGIVYSHCICPSAKLCSNFLGLLTATAVRAYNETMDITLADLEQAINHWRHRRPSTGEERALSPEVNILAKVYALMIFHQQKSIALETIDPAARQLIEAWQQQLAA